MAKPTDLYSNILVARLTMSAADTLTFSEVQVGFSIFERLGILISRIEYHPTAATVHLFNATQDRIVFGVTASDELTSLDPTSPAVIDTAAIYGVASGAPADLVVTQWPMVKDYSNLRGGGLLITPRPWFVAMTSNSLGTAGACYVRFYFTVEKLADADYFELLETRHYFG